MFNPNNFNKQIAILPLELLEIAPYQKALKPNLVKKIVKNYDPRGIGVLQVSKRNNQYWVFDGQHRLSALKELGARTVDVIVYSGMTYEDESKAFEFFNTTSQASPLDVANAKLERNEPQAVKIDQLVKSVGLEIDYRKTNGYGKIIAYKALEVVYTKHGADVLRKALMMIKDAFGTQGQNIFSSDNIKGFAEFLVRYENHPNYKENILAKWLRKTTLEEFKFESDKIKKLYNKAGGESVVIQLLEIHNSHRNHENRLS